MLDMTDNEDGMARERSDNIWESIFAGVLLR